MWAINTTDRFDRWFTSLDDTDRASVLAAMLVLREKGPGLSRPYADTLKGSRHSNMKELRIQSKGDPLLLAEYIKREGIARWEEPLSSL
ncbi:type II toxin-antitoxin system RelE/ParE family toxin [Enterobacter quasimori]|nr:type II toxin-antitoxin system RelE/ParE family toxin [Enterobacter quasimori]